MRLPEMASSVNLFGGIGKRYLLCIAAISGAFLALFLIVEVLNPSLLTDPSDRLHQSGPPAAILGVGLLVADAVLPVPSSLVMTALGAAFGVPVGTILSVAGSTGCTLLCFAIGRSGGPMMARLVPPAERSAANRSFSRWGGLAIVASRPIPLLAETVAVLAGASPMGWGRAALAAVVGAVPPALLYALIGASAIDLRSGAWVLLVAIVAGGATWFLGQRLSGPPSPGTDTAGSPD